MRPAVTDGVAIPHVDRDGDAGGAVGIDEAAGEGRVLERGRPDRDPRRSGIQGVRDRTLVAKATGHLDPVSPPTASTIAAIT